MKVPDWRTLVLSDGVLPEPTPGQDQLVLWVRGNRVNGFQEWERVSTSAHAKVAVEDGFFSTVATLVHARQMLHGFVGKLLRRFRGSSGDTRWLLPNGTSAEQCGQRQTDLLLIWSNDETAPVDEACIKSRWPNGGRVQQVGKSLFVVHGTEPVGAAIEPSQPLPQGDSLQIAEQLLTAARKQTDRAKLVSALTDLGVVLSQEGKCQRAIELLEEALVLARQIQDKSKECDVLGNLGLALGPKNPRRALELLQQELTLARAASDRFAEKTALSHLGLFYLRARDSTQALACLEEALSIARTLGDRQHEADLLWLIAIVYAEMGLRDQGIGQAQAAVGLLEAMGKPQAKVLKEHLRKYQAGEAAASLAGNPGTTTNAISGGFGSEFIIASGVEAQGVVAPRHGSTGPGLLRMGFSAAKAMARFIGSGMKRVSPATYQQRQRTCATCEHHTGLRCKLCGCFTNMKAWLPREECPVKKWSAV